MKIWQGLALAVSTFTMTNAAQADFIGLYGSVDYWYLQGDYNQTKNDLGDLSNRDFDVDKAGQAQIAVSFEHPIPLIPNVRLRHVNIDSEVEKKIAGQSAFEFDVDNTDLILYYEILDNIVSVDVGVAAKRLDGEVAYINAIGLTDRVDISKTAPMLYGSVGGKLPFTGLSVKAEALITSYSKTDITDVSAEVKYNFIENLAVDLGGKVGYRLLNIDLEDQNGADTKFNFSGPYLGLEVHF